MDCPKCKAAFKTIIYEGVEIDQCQKCGGTWLDDGEIAKIVDIEEETFSPELIRETLTHVFEGIPQQEQDAAVSCPKCQADMFPVNYAYSSGIIVDRCPRQHGIWLDGSELDKLQVYKEDQTKVLEGKKKEWIDMVKSVAGNHRKIVEQEYQPRTPPVDFIISKILKKVSDLMTPKPD
jgi:Zn-finger nucleic acid-binding protein